VQLHMTDRDVLEKASWLFKRRINGPYSRTKSKWASIYTITWYNKEAVQLSMTIYSLMGERRQAKIREMITNWRGFGSSIQPDFRFDPQ